MKRLQDTLDDLYDKMDEFCPGAYEDEPDKPVKVAILDTGAYMSRDYYKHQYQGRLRECRTWLRTDDVEGQKFPIGENDDDGHGTHGASVLLEATKNLNIHLCVAQIFAARHEKVAQEGTEGDDVVTRIVNVSVPALIDPGSR